MHIKRVIKTIILLIILIISFVGFSSKVFSYSTAPTHPNLAKDMIRLYNMYYDPDITDEKVRQILQGSIDEDMAPRWSFHLYDPIYNRAPFGTYTAKQWAINSNIQGSAIHKFANLLFNLFGKKENEFSYHGDFSWTANVNNYAQNKQNDAWYGLGHILHLIADMTVPSHSRNDHHVLGDPYESWTGANLKDGDYIFADKLYENRHWPVDIDYISQAFDDLAMYSNKYFFSKDTIFSKDYFIPNVVKKQSEDSGFVGQDWYVWVKDEQGELFRLAKIKTLESAWRDMTPSIKEEMAYEIVDDDRNLHSDYFTRLAPKAVQYGAGVIKLFIEDAEYEKAKLARQKNPSQIAQVFNSLSSIAIEMGLSNPEYHGLPEIVPSKLPAPLLVVMPKEEPVNLPINESVPPIEVVSQPNTPNPPINETNKINEPIIVSGPIVGGDGGLSQGVIEQINNPPDLVEEISTSSEPLVPPLPPPPPIPPVLPPHLVINEIQVRDNEFVELYNPTGSSIDITGYYFSYYSSARDWNNPYRNQEFLASASIPANGYYLIGLEGYVASNGNPNVDWQPYTTNQLNNSNGSIAIFSFDPTTKTVSESQDEAIDAVSWGSVDFVKEKAEFQTGLGQDKSMQRMGYQDNNDNSNDFEYKKIPSPTNSLNQTRTPGTVIKDNLIISQNTTWTIAGSPYYIESNAGQWPIVESGATLTIEPGVVVMPQNSFYTSLEVRGTLKAEGTAADKIVFTSKNDSDFGGIGSASAGDWKNIRFTPTSNNSILKNVVFRYGGIREGLNQIETETIKVDGGSIEMENITVEKSLTRGLRLINSNSKIKNSSFMESKVGILIEGSADISVIESSLFKNNSEHGLQIVNNASPIIKNNQFVNNGQVGTGTRYVSQGAIVVYSAYPNFEGNQVSNNLINGILVHSESVFDQDVVWSSDLPHVLTSNFGDYITVGEGATLTLEPNTVIKPWGSYYTPLLVKGTLLAEAVSGSEIVFTSIYDDTFGGDTNNDGNLTIPQSNDWKKIKFDSTSTGSVLDHVFMYYGTGVPPIEMVGSASVDIRDTISYTP